MPCSGSSSRPTRQGSFPVIVSPARHIAVLATACALSLGLSGCGGGSQQADSPESAASSSAPAPTDGPDSAASDTAAQPTDTQSSEGESATSCLDMAKELDRKDQIGQLLMVGTNTVEPEPSVAEAIKEYGIGSVLYLGPGPRSLSGTAKVGENLQGNTGAQPPLLFATDQEGGQVQRLEGEGFSDLPSAVTQGRLSEAELRSKWLTWGQELKDAGVLYDLAPDADVVPAGTESGNAAVGALKRHYGSDPETVSAKATAVVEGLRDAGVASSLKHYPGLGRAAVNTDFGSATDDVTTLDDTASFTGPMAAGASSVMISSTIYSKVDPGVHAVFSSKIITEGLRGKEGWQKVVISDDLGAAAAVKEVPVAERAVRFVQAGGDLVINADPSSVGEMAKGLAKKADEDQAFADDLPEHAARVLALKAEVGLVECKA